jgi:four helix bundle protein
MLNLSHKKLDVWYLSKNFVKDIYKVTNSFPSSEVYITVNQLKRAAISVASNIAEGSSRNSALERKRFYVIARSSLVEIDTQLEITSELGFLSKENYDELSVKINKLFAFISKLIQST